ncbi:MAG: methyltransferase [Chitinophagaceae bacterium]|nr:methyltransferase [Oligoflexus sp.]
MNRAQILDLMRSVTKLESPRLVPELTLALVTAQSPWWSQTPDDLEGAGIAEPFWGFAWGGGQCVARYILDNPDLVRGKHVIDFGAGGGLITLAALLCDAAEVVATEIDPWAIMALEMNIADRPGRQCVIMSCEDWIGRPLPQGTMLLCGDMSYEENLTVRLLDWFATLEGCTILIGDPGRGFVDGSLFEVLARYMVPSDNDSDGTVSVEGAVLLYAPKSGRSDPVY